MTGDITLAFAHPEDRARATAAPGLPDRISLRDHIVETEIGAFQPERGRRQRLAFNVVVEVRPESHADDDVDRILSYDRITESIAAELARERLNLLETLAERVAARILAAPQALRAFVRIEKLDLGPGVLGVEIVRSADARPEAAEAADNAPRLALILMSNAAMASPRLPRWLDGIEAAAVPAILCVGPPDQSPPQTGAWGPQRRINLLAIEQNAWVLAARDDRCVVVATRTELDWSRGKRRISVWAPSKMVLDATHGPEGHAAADLALWLAHEVGAARMIAVDATLPGAEARDIDAESLL